MSQFKFNEESGPQTDTISDGTESNQSVLFQELKLYNLTDDLNNTTDFFLVDEINGIKYYHPNDETWGAIIAVSYEHELAIYTGFYEMDDMANTESGYTQTVKNGVIGCEFIFETY